MHPIAFNASLYRWQVFVTLTYDSQDDCGNALKVPDEAGRRKMLFAFLRRCGMTKRVKVGADLDRRLSYREAQRVISEAKNGKRVNRLPFAHLLWMAREERGEAGGRYHYHILLGGFEPSMLNRSTYHALKALWEDIGGGFADVRSFDTRLPGVRYVLKGLNEWSPALANAYEMRKAGTETEDRELILADACVRKWAHVSGMPRATGGACDRVITRAPSLLRRKFQASLTAKETPAELDERIRSNWLNRHPAGVSFVV